MGSRRYKTHCVAEVNSEFTQSGVVFHFKTPNAAEEQLRMDANKTSESCPLFSNPNVFQQGRFGFILSFWSPRLHKQIFSLDHYIHSESAM